MWRQVVSRLNVSNEVQDGCIKDNLITLECLQNSVENPAIRVGNNLYDINTVNQLRALRDPATNEKIAGAALRSLKDAQKNAHNELVVTRAFGMNAQELFERWKAFAMSEAVKTEGIPRGVLHTPRLDVVCTGVNSWLDEDDEGEYETLIPAYALHVVDERLPAFARHEGAPYARTPPGHVEFRIGFWPTFDRSDAQGVRPAPLLMRDFLHTLATVIEFDTSGHQRDEYLALVRAGNLHNVEFGARFMSPDTLRDAPGVAVESGHVEVARWLVRASRRADVNLLAAAEGTPQMLYMLLEEYDAMFRASPGVKDAFQNTLLLGDYRTGGEVVQEAVATLAQYPLTPAQRQFLATL